MPSTQHAPVAERADADLPSTAVVTADADVFSCELAGGAALLDLRTSTYYSINAVGSEVWRLIQQPIAVADLHEALLSHFDVERTRCYEDLVALLGELRGAGLIKVENAAAG